MANIGSVTNAVVGPPRRSLEQYGDQLLFYVKAHRLDPASDQALPP